MWIVAKVKKKEFEIFKKDIIKKAFCDIKFYCPKIEYSQYANNKFKKLEKFLLGNYIFCYSPNFNNLFFLNKLRFIKGLEYFLNGNYQNQEEIQKFIKYCRKYENSKGYITQSFFKTTIKNKAEFISGPFTNMMFEILKKQKNKLQIIVGNIVTTISDNNNYLYRSV